MSTLFPYTTLFRSRAAQRVVSVEGLRRQARGVLEVTQLIVEVALQTGAVLALEIRQLIDRTLQRRLLRFEGRQGLIALGLEIGRASCRESVDGRGETG